MNSEQIEKLNDIDWKEQYIRLLADFENTKRREAKAISDSKKRTLIDVFTNLIPIYWDFHKGVNNGWIDDVGIVSTFKNFKNFFIKSYKMQIVDTEYINRQGSVFDYNYMSAVGHVPTEDKELNNKVHDIVLPGLIDEQGEVLVFTKVIVYRVV